MRAVRRVNTGPEMQVRRLLDSLGVRYTIHSRKLPGTPDLVLSKYQTAILVNGCFWHRHEGCRKATTPKTRQEFWATKFCENVARDSRNARALRRIGWSVLTIWECQLAKLDRVRKRIFAHLQRRIVAVSR